jgi:hypothetical protein
MEDIGGDLITGLVQGLFFLVGGVFALVGAGFVLLAFAATLQHLLSRGWPTVPGIIRHASVEERQVETTASHRARIVYDYEVGGRQYTSDRLAFSRSGSRKRAEADKAKYPPGKLVHVYYNPKRPQRAIIERRAGVAGTLVLLFIGAMLGGAGAVAIWAGLEVGAA